MPLEEANPIPVSVAGFGLEPRLADPGFTGDGDDRAASVEELFEDLLQVRQLRLPADQGTATTSFGAASATTRNASTGSALPFNSSLPSDSSSKRAAT